MFLKDWITKINTFLNDKNNPTKVTAEQAGTYTKAEIENMLARKMNLVDLPISHLGDFNRGTIATSVPTAQHSVTITEDCPYFIAGKRGNLRNVSFTFPAGVASYVYLTVENNDVKLITRNNVISESPTDAFCGTADGANTVQLKPFIRLGVYRLATIKQGSSIPVASGDPTTDGTFPWQI